MKIIGNKEVWLGIWMCAMLAVAGPAFARGPQGVSKTRHNLSASATGFVFRSDEDQVCIFCHTPHGSSTDGPLWNRTNSAELYTHYTSSTLSTAVAGSRSANISPESMLCLSCHDGSISMYTVINPSNDIGQPTAVANFTGKMRGATGVNQGPTIGFGRNADGSVNVTGNGDLSDDHPISFKYLPVYNDATKNNSARLHTINEAETAGVRFLPANAVDADKRVECSSCHDPHVNYIDNTTFAPFLITPNTGSALCLACHIK